MHIPWTSLTFGYPIPRSTFHALNHCPRPQSQPSPLPPPVPPAFSLHLVSHCHHLSSHQPSSWHPDRPVSPAASPPFSNPQPNLTFPSLRSGLLWMDRRPRSCQPSPVPTISFAARHLAHHPPSRPLYLPPEFPLPALGAQPFLPKTLVLPILHLFPLPPSCYLLVSFLN